MHGYPAALHCTDSAPAPAWAAVVSAGPSGDATDGRGTSNSGGSSMGLWWEVMAAQKSARFANGTSYAWRTTQKCKLV